MPEALTEEGSPDASSGAPTRFALHEGPYLGRYPLILPKPTDPRMHLALVTITLQVLGQVVFDFELSIAQILISIGTCAAIELVVTFRRDRTIAWPASAMLTGNGIALILRVPGTVHGDWWSLKGWWVFVGCGVLAMASKYLIRCRGRHIFNPSNFALVVTFLALGETRADPQVLWWGPLSVGLVVAFAVILAGSITITRRVGQSHSAVAFWVTFASAVAVIAASGHAITARWHVGPIEGFGYWWLLVTSPEVLVFLFFMITDPKTAPRHNAAQVVYGCTIAVLAALMVATQSGEFGTKVGILAALVIVCPFVWWIDSHIDQFAVPAHRLRWATGIAAFSVVLTTVLVVLGSTFTAEAGVDVPLQRRGEVQIDPADLPEISIAEDAVVSSVNLDADMARRMGVATAEDLLLEARALASGDVELASAALSGTRLAQAEQQIESEAESGPKSSYEFETLTATVMRTAAGPQVPPQLAVRVTGKSRSSGATEPLDATYILTPVADTFLITDALDGDGKPIGARPGADPAIESAVDSDGPPATGAELDGLGFEDVTDQVGLDLDHSDRQLVEGPAAESGGAAVGDYDRDGDPDIFLTRVGLPNALMRNDAGDFTDVTDESGITSTPTDSGSTGAMWVDINGDTRLDLIVLGLGRTPNRLWMAAAGGGFVDATERWGLPTEPPPSADSAMFSLAAADYDRDGWVDLILTDSEPHGITDRLRDSVDAGTARCAAAEKQESTTQVYRSRTTLLRNTGSGFENHTDRLGFDTSSVAAMTPRFADVNSDGWQDLLIAGRLCSSRVLMNDTDGGFVDKTLGSGIGHVETANGSELLDANGDGVLDWFVTGVSYPTASGECPIPDPAASCSGNHLLLGNGDGTFTDATDQFGLSDGFWGWGTAATDFNLNGRTDLMMTNGYRGVAASRPDDGSDPLRPFYDRGVEDPDRLWLNLPDGSWPEVAEQVRMTGDGAGKAAVPLDFDSDGLVDVLVVNTQGPPTLYRNDSHSTNSWLGVTLTDPESHNTAGIGATITAELSNGDVRTERISPDGSFQSGRAARSHFGFPNDLSVESLTITWPDGVSTRLGAQRSNTMIRVTDRQDR